MTSTFGIGITTSFGEGVESGLQRAIVRDATTGEWFYVETLFSGITLGVLPLDGSLDFFTLRGGLGVHDLEGPGYISGISLITTSGLIMNSSGQVIGVQTGFQSNLSYGGAATSTTVIPLSNASGELLAALMVPLTAALIGGLLFGFGWPVLGAAAAWGFLLSPLISILTDPLSLDLDGDGIELVSLANSTTHFDLDGNGFAERTGWVASDDGILVRDGNRNGNVDSVAELFGSATQDGFAVLETFDDNHDGKIDALDAVFADLKVWRDLNQNGVSEAGELFSLAQLGIQSISVQTQDVTGTNQGHDLGVTALFTRTDGTTGNATSIYFQTDGQNSVPDETGFTPAAGVNQLPQLPRSGNLHSTGSPPAVYRLRAGQKLWMATNDADFRADLTALVNSAGMMGATELRSAFEALLLNWAGADVVPEGSRGAWLDARRGNAIACNDNVWIGKMVA